MSADYLVGIPLESECVDGLIKEGYTPFNIDSRERIWMYKPPEAVTSTGADNALGEACYWVWTHIIKHENIRADVIQPIYAEYTCWASRSGRLLSASRGGHESDDDYYLRISQMEEAMGGSHQ